MEHSYWAIWARTLQQKKLTGLVVTLLEGSGPLKILLSQVMMGIMPLINQNPNGSWQSFAEMLEDAEECRSFSDYLSKEEIS